MTILYNAWADWSVVNLLFPFTHCRVLHYDLKLQANIPAEVSLSITRWSLADTFQRICISSILEWDKVELSPSATINETYNFFLCPPERWAHQCTSISFPFAIFTFTPFLRRSAQLFREIFSVLSSPSLSSRHRTVVSWSWSDVPARILLPVSLIVAS